jgi:dTDP-glucose 4,6-dehydratase
VTDRQGHDRRYALDSGRLRALGWAPQVEFREGRDATVRWYRDNPAWWRPIKHQDAGYKSYYEAQYASR